MLGAPYPVAFPASIHWSRDHFDIKTSIARRDRGERDQATLAHFNSFLSLPTSFNTT